MSLGSVAVERVMFDVWEDMRRLDQPLADEVLEPAFEFMRAQTDKSRLHITELGEYLKCRERDVGKGYV